MNINLDQFLIYLAHAANFATIGSLLTALIYAVKNRGIGILDAKLQWFFVYFIRSLFLLVTLYIVFYIIIIPIFIFITVFIFDYSGVVVWWSEQHSFGFTIAYIICTLLFLVATYILSGIIITLSLNHAKKFINTLFNGNIKLKIYSNLYIIGATYYTNSYSLDVTNQLKSMIVENKLVVKAGNHIAGDPDYGVPKKLKVEYIYGSYSDNPQVVEVNEGENIKLP